MPLHFNRMFIQVLISGHSQTKVATVHLDSLGRTLYQMIQGRHRKAVMIHGANIIRLNASLQEQGIHHLSTVFVVSMMGEGGGRTRLGKHLGKGKE